MINYSLAMPTPASASVTRTTVISVKIAEIRKRYGKNRYKNVAEWESDSPNHVYIGRANSIRIKDPVTGAFTPWPAKGQGSPFANPFSAKKYGRERCIQMYREWLAAKLETDLEFREQLRQLDGKTLGCWCKPEACHGDVMVEFITSLRDHVKTHDSAEN